MRIYACQGWCLLLMSPSGSYAREIVLVLSRQIAIHFDEVDVKSVLTTIFEGFLSTVAKTSYVAGPYIFAY